MNNDEIFLNVNFLKELNKLYGLNDIPNCKIIPMGYRCSSSEIIRILNLKVKNKIYAHNCFKNGTFL